MRSLYKGRAANHAAGIKYAAILMTALIPPLVALYDALFSAMSEHTTFPLTPQEVGVLAAGIGAFITAVSHIISSPKIGLPGGCGGSARFLDDPEMLRKRSGESDL